MPARTRILYYSHTRQVSGGERVLFNMLEVLDRTLYEPLVACPWQSPGDLDEQLRQRGFQPLEAPVLNARFTSNPIKLVGYLASTIRAIRAFRATIRQAAPDLLHANSVRAGLVATLATLGAGTRILWHVHDDLPRHPITTFIRAIALRSRRSDFVAVSHATARTFSAGQPFGPRMHVLHNSVDRSRFPRKSVPLDAEALAFRGMLGLKRDDFLAVCVGMINPRKGQLELMDTWSILVQDLDQAHAHLAVVGAPIFNDDHRYEAQVIARQRELKLDHVRFTGPRKDIPAILRAADVLILNATAEPFGLVLLEAMSSGTPVIATSVGGIPEIVRDGCSGFLVPSPSNLDEEQKFILPRQLVYAIAHPEQMANLAEAAHSDVLPRFSTEVFRAGLHDLYTGLKLR